MPRDPTNEILIEALADAMEGRTGVLFLVRNADVIEGLISTTRRIATEHVRSRMGPAAAGRSIFTASTNEWVINTLGGGWVFFYPADLLSADEDIGGPSSVYWCDSRGSYRKVPYAEWKRLRAAGHTWRPNTPGKSVGVKPSGPKTAWDRLLDDEFEG